MSIVHAFSNTVADATGTVTAWNGATTASVAATDIVRPSDWNSGHNQLYTLSGNTSNASTASGTNVVFQAAGGITLAGSTNTIVISGPAQLSQYVYPPGPLPMATSTFVSGTSGATGGSTQHTVSAYVSPIYLDHPLVYNEAEILFSGQASSAGTGSISNGYMVGIYTQTGSTLSLLTSHQFAHVATQNSVTAQTHSWWWGTNSTSNSSSLGGNVSATFTRLANANLYNGAAVTLPAGTYYQAVVHTQRTAGLAICGISSAMCHSASQSTGASYFGQASYKAPLGDERWHGQFSTTMNAANSGLLSMPSAISSSAITNTGGSSQVRIPVVRYYASST